MNKFRYFSLTSAAICFGVAPPLVALASTAPGKTAATSAADARTAALAEVAHGVVQGAELESAPR